jgi:thiol-disulfide isomerase/thioredoxin
MKRIVLAGILLSGLLAACDNSMKPRTSNSFEEMNQKNKLAGSQLPSLKLVNIRNEPFDLASLKGKKLLVNLWASWCLPCVEEMPSLDELYGKMDTSKSTIVLLSVDKDRKKGVEFALKNGIQSPVYFAEQALPSLFEVSGIPTTFIFNEKGELVDRIEGARNYNSAAYHEFFQ